MKLSDYISRLDRLTGRSYMDRVKDGVASAGLTRVASEFARQSDPYGAAWAPIKRPGRILYKSGALSQSFTAYPTPTGVKFVSSVPYAVYQQPKRNMLPTERYGLPLQWLDDVRKVFNKNTKDELRP